MSPRQPLKPELSTVAVPGVSVSPQALVMTGRVMLSVDTCARQETVASPLASVMAKSSGTMWKVYVQEWAVSLTV